MCTVERALLCLIGGAMLLSPPLARSEGSYGLGRAASEAEIRGWDIDVRADGAGLPAGSGSAERGDHIYRDKCAVCHGDRGQGGPMDRLAGGEGTLASKTPVRTVGSFWPYATTLFDYIRRAMPFNAPQSLAADDVYALTAYILFLNGILPAGAALDRDNLARVQMPNRNHFVDEPRPDARAVPCLTDCR